jgi:ABC-type oligopeptide transport system substrate-binding subunit
MFSRSRFAALALLVLAACGKPAPPAPTPPPAASTRLAPLDLSAPSEARITEARRLLAEAGFPDGKGFPELEILYNTSEGVQKIASALQEMWRTRLGLKLVLRNTEWKVYLDLTQKGRFQIARRAYFGEYMDPESFLSLFTADSAFNSGGWTSEEYNRLIATSDRENDPAKRFALLARAERILVDESPLIPLYTGVAHNLIKPFIKGVHPNARDMHPLQGVTLEGPGAPKDGVMIFNIASEPHSIDPALADDIAGLKVIQHLFEGLANYDPRDGTPIPAGAEKWDVSPDGLRWTFPLRPATWSNGDPVTAEDFVWSWRRAMHPKMPSAYKERMFVLKNARAISRGEAAVDSLGVRAEGDRTLVVDLEHPAPYFPWLACLMVYMPVHRATVEKHGDKWIEPGHMVHNGPYRLAEVRRNDRMIFEANPRYRAANEVKLKKFVFLHVVDDRTAFSLYETGQCHWLFRMPLEQMDALRGRADHSQTTANLSQFYTFNLRTKPLDDVRVRRALSLAVDRETIVKRVLRGGEEPSFRLSPPIYPGYDVK